VKLAFYLIATAMIAVALLLLLLPLVRHGRMQGRPRGIFALAMCVSVVVPMAAVGLYLIVGSPTTLNGVQRAEPNLSIDQAVHQLAH